MQEPDNHVGVVMVSEVEQRISRPGEESVAFMKRSFSQLLLRVKEISRLVLLEKGETGHESDIACMSAESTCQKFHM